MQYFSFSGKLGRFIYLYISMQLVFYLFKGCPSVVKPSFRQASFYCSVVFFFSKGKLGFSEIACVPMFPNLFPIKSCAYSSPTRSNLATEVYLFPKTPGNSSKSSAGLQFLSIFLSPKIFPTVSTNESASNSMSSKSRSLKNKFSFFNTLTGVSHRAKNSLQK